MGPSGDYNYNQRMNVQLSIIKDLGYSLKQGATVLDLGCGNGKLLNEYRKARYNAYGCDFDFRPDASKSFVEDGIIRKIKTDVYRLPFDDNTFDYVYSDQVFEHVNDYSTTLAELKRVLKPGGVSLHFFPSRYKAIEVHVKVPFSSLIRNKYWLRLWANLGIKNSYQKGLSPRERAMANHDFFEYSNELPSKIRNKKVLQHLLPSRHFW